VTTAYSSTLDHPTAPAGRGTRIERRRRTDAVVSRLKAVDQESSDSRELLVHQLIESNIEVANSIATRYVNRGIDLDDLQQVALLGLTKAAQRFDPDAGHDFLAFAVPTIRGEVRRHFRDAGWVVRPPRRVQEMQARIQKAQAELEQQIGRSPRPTEVASHLGVDVDDVVEALSVDGCFSPASLDTPLDDVTTTLGSLIGDDDVAMEALEAKVMLEPLIAELPERDRQILRMRFFEERTQSEIAAAVGLTQAHVSRILSGILAQLREGLGGTQPAA
jgi:RNA polymerase sigma-B factor